MPQDVEENRFEVLNKHFYPLVLMKLRAIINILKLILSHIIEPTSLSPLAIWLCLTTPLISILSYDFTSSSESLASSLIGSKLLLLKER